MLLRRGRARHDRRDRAVGGRSEIGTRRAQRRQAIDDVARAGDRDGLMPALVNFQRVFKPVPRANDRRVGSALRLPARKDDVDVHRDAHGGGGTRVVRGCASPPRHAEIGSRLSDRPVLAAHVFVHRFRRGAAKVRRDLSRRSSENVVVRHAHGPANIGGVVLQRGDFRVRQRASGCQSDRRHRRGTNPSHSTFRGRGASECRS